MPSLHRLVPFCEANKPVHLLQQHNGSNTLSTVGKQAAERSSGGVAAKVTLTTMRGAQQRPAQASQQTWNRPLAHLTGMFTDRHVQKPRAARREARRGAQLAQEHTEGAVGVPAGVQQHTKGWEVQEERALSVHQHALQLSTLQHPRLPGPPPANKGAPRPAPAPPHAPPYPTNAVLLVMTSKSSSANCSECRPAAETEARDSGRLQHAAQGARAPAARTRMHACGRARARTAPQGARLHLHLALLTLQPLSP